MPKRTPFIAGLIGLMGVIICASCNSPYPTTPNLTTNPVSSSSDFISTNTPLPIPTIIPTKTPAPATCPWIAYFYDGEAVTSPGNESCLDGLKGIHISKNSKQISFFLSRSSSLGTYGVCRDVSEQDNLKFSVAINNNIASARFLIMVGHDPVPTQKSSVGFRIQPEIFENKEKGMWIKLIEYAADNFENDKGGMRAITDWSLNDVWIFDFAFQFSGSQVSASMNKKALSRVWPLSSSRRYLCFAYQQTPSANNATELDAQVNFP